MVRQATMDLKELKQREGKTLCGRYNLEELIGVGGMAAVYRGTHRNGNKVAIKILHTELSVSKEIHARFLREGYAANKVDHRGVVRVTDDDVSEDGAAFLVMELLEGETLKEYIARQGGTLTDEEIAPMMCQLLEVLAAAHKNGIVHRDIKPDNLFLESATGAVKVLDFGIARMEGEHTATRTGRMIGTPGYMSPEQARGQTKLIDGQSDLWAVGAVFFRSLAGQLVFRGETPEMTMIQAATEPPPRLADLAPSIDPELCAIVDRALAPAKEERWPTAESMLEALEKLGYGRVSQVLSTPASRAEGGGARDSRRSIKGLAIVSTSTPASVTTLNLPTRQPQPPGEPEEPGLPPETSEPPSVPSTMIGVAEGTVPGVPTAGSTRWVLVAFGLLVFGLVGAALFFATVLMGSPSSSASSGASSGQESEDGAPSAGDARPGPVPSSTARKPGSAPRVSPASPAKTGSPVDASKAVVPRPPASAPPAAAEKRASERE